MNDFTGIVYQSVLQPVRTVGVEESVQPNTSPAQWPGDSSKPETTFYFQQEKERNVLPCALILGLISPLSSLSPGIASLIRLLSSAGEESQPGLAVLLCEILTAVFLSVFVHGLATHSSNELFHIVAHPLNSKLWVTVFGGGARIPVIEKVSSPTRTPPPGQ